jgi:hypothetical protein
VVAFSRAVTELLSPFAFQSPGQPPLLILRCGVLFFSLSVLRQRRLEAAIVALLFLLSLAVSGALYPFVLVAACLAGVRRGADGTAYAVLAGSLVTAIALLAASHLKTEDGRPSPGDPAAMVAYWQARRNPYEARWWAVAWTQQEMNEPGAAYLALASIDHDLGRDVQARKVLAKVLARPADDATRARAESMHAAWDTLRPAQP